MSETAFNPLTHNPLETRSDLERAVHALFDPLLPYFSPGGARVKLSTRAALFGCEAEELEGFARPLYGLVPLALGGGQFDHWELYRRGLSAGTEPAHPEYWGSSGTDQRTVERAALGFALAFLPDQIFEPLTQSDQSNLIHWLDEINQHAMPENNWQFFRVLVNLGLARVGAKVEPGPNQRALYILESHYQGDGYYHDGPPGRVDYYVPWAYHTYGLIYAASPLADPGVAARYRDRAQLFARRYQYWFAANGAAIPFGRSQTYRFAQAAFWGALVMADLQALPWPRIKGLYLRHLRYWSELPIAERDGILSLGYGYNQPGLCEAYSSACSPYWCMKYFLAMAAPEDHPFWSAPEETAEAFESDLERLRYEPHARAVFVRAHGHATRLNAGQEELRWGNTPAKYGKFAYSSYFGFSIAEREVNPAHGVHDSMLALREDYSEAPWQVRVRSFEHEVSQSGVYSHWWPFEGVRVDTVLIPGDGGWHFRLHCVTTSRPLVTSEQGFALGLGPEQAAEVKTLSPEQPRPSLPAALDGAVRALGSMADDPPSASPWAIAITNPLGLSGLCDQIPVDPWLQERQVRRQARAFHATSGTHLLWRRTVIPELGAKLAPGRHVLACAVLGLPRVITRGDVAASFPVPPAWPAFAEPLLLKHCTHLIPTSSRSNGR